MKLKPNWIQATGIVALFGGIVLAIVLEGSYEKILCGIVAFGGAIAWFYGVSK